MKYFIIIINIIVKTTKLLIDLKTLDNFRELTLHSYNDARNANTLVSFTSSPPQLVGPCYRFSFLFIAKLDSLNPAGNSLLVPLLSAGPVPLSGCSVLKARRCSSALRMTNRPLTSGSNLESENENLIRQFDTTDHIQTSSVLFSFYSLSFTSFLLSSFFSDPFFLQLSISFKRNVFFILFSILLK